MRPLSTDDRHLVELPELASIGHPFKIHVFTVPSSETAEQLQASLRVGKNNERLEGYICSRLLFLLNAAQPIQNVDGNPSRINLNNLWLLQDVWIMVIVQSRDPRPGTFLRLAILPAGWQHHRRLQGWRPGSAGDR